MTDIDWTTAPNPELPVLLNTGKIVRPYEWAGQIIFDPLLDGNNPAERARVAALRRNQVAATFCAIFVFPESLYDYSSGNFRKSDIVRVASMEDIDEFTQRRGRQMATNEYYRKYLTVCCGCGKIGGRYVDWDGTKYGDVTADGKNAPVCDECVSEIMYMKMDQQTDIEFDLLDYWDKCS